MPGKSSEMFPSVSYHIKFLIRTTTHFMSAGKSRRN